MKRTIVETEDQQLEFSILFTPSTATPQSKPQREREEQAAQTLDHIPDEPDRWDAMFAGRAG